MNRHICGSVEDLIGNTPLVRLNALPAREGASVFAKLDYFNPGFSVKDRIVMNMVRDAENRGVIRKGGTIVEASSGNTAVSLALIGRLKGYKTLVVMPDTDNEVFVKKLERFGAKVELTPFEEGARGAREKVKELCEKNRDFHNPDQFNNPSNPEIHRNTTAREILKCMGNRKVDAFVAGVGTGGTITGVGEALKSKNPDARIIAVEPAESPVLSGGKPGRHFINGIGAGFIPPLLNRDIIDSVMTVSSEEADECSARLASTEGILAGISSGAVLSAALKVAGGMDKGKNVVAFFADAMAGV